MNVAQKPDPSRSRLRANGPTALPAGTPAPDFALKSTPDQTVRLELRFARWRQSRGSRNFVCAGGAAKAGGWKMKRDARGGAQLSALPMSDRDHIQGPIDAPFMLLEYGDYECPYCGEAYPVVKELQKRLCDRLCFAFRNFPLVNSHPHAQLHFELV